MITITKEQAKRLAEVATAIAEGKRVTYTYRDEPFSEPCILDPGYVYTIHEPAPEPKWRPWTLEEAVDNIGRVVRFGNDRAVRLVVAVHDYEGETMIRLGGMERAITSVYALNSCQFLDGTPCGVRE